MALPSGSARGSRWVPPAPGMIAHRTSVSPKVAWGAAITCFGLVSWLPLALVLLAAAGFADVISAVFRSTIIQLAVPDALRGRLAGLQIAVVTGGPRVGDLEAGAVAGARWNPPRTLKAQRSRAATRFRGCSDVS